MRGSSTGFVAVDSIPRRLCQLIDELDVRHMSGTPERLFALAIDWLREHIPAYDLKASFGARGRGPGNFMFQGWRGRCGPRLE